MEAMATKPRVLPSATQGPPLLSTSSPTGSLPIRAPLTPDDDDSDVESSGYRTDTSDSHVASSLVNGSDGFASGVEDFESASERVSSVRDPDDASWKGSGSVNKVRIFRPFVANPDEESLDNSVIDDESGVAGVNSPVVEFLDSVKLVMPIAQLSLDDDDFDGLLGSEESFSEEEDGNFSGVAKIPSLRGLQRVDAPRVKLLEDDEEEELLVGIESSDVNLSKSFPMRENEDFLLSEDAVLQKTIELEEDNKGFVVHSVPAELDQDEGLAINAKTHGDSLVKEGRLEEDSELDNNVEQSNEAKESIEVTEDALLTTSMYDVGNHVAEQSGIIQIEKHALINGTVTEPVDNNFMPELQELKVDSGTMLTNQIVEVDNSFEENAFVTALLPVDGSTKAIVPDIQRLKLVGVDIKADENEDVSANKLGGVVSETIGIEKVSASEKLEGSSWQESHKSFDSFVAEDAIIVASVDNVTTSWMNEIQNASMRGNCDFSEISDGDRLEGTWSINSNGIGNKYEEAEPDSENLAEEKVLISEEDIEDLLSAHHRTTKHIQQTSCLSEVKDSDYPQRIEEQNVMDSDEELYTEEEELRGNELFDSAALVSVLKAITNAELHGKHFETTSANDLKVSSLDGPAGFGSSFNKMRPVSPLDMTKEVMKEEVSEEEKKMMEKIQHIRVKFLRVVRRLGQSPEDSIAAQVLQKLVSVSGVHFSNEFSLESAKRMSMQLEAEGKDDLDFSLNILVLGKTGVGKSATINSIFGEKKVTTNAFEPSTTRVKEIVGTIDGVRVRILDTPGLRSSVKEQSINRKILTSVKKFMERFPPDVVLYVDRLDTHARDLSDLPLLRSLTNSLTASIWRNTIITLTHAASPLPDGPSGSPLHFEVFVAQQSHAVQQAISQAIGDLRLMHPSMMHPVSLIENHPLCMKNESKEVLLPNGQSWRPQLLLLCYSLKILSEVRLVSKPQDPHDHSKLLGSWFRPLPLSHLVSSLLQSCRHRTLTGDQGDVDVDFDVELEELSDLEEDDYYQLPPFKPLRKSQLEKLSKEQKRAYFEEYDYRVKLLQKKQWGEEMKRLKEMKKKGKVGKNSSDNLTEVVDQEGGSTTVPVPLPDFALPNSFDGDNPTYRYRVLEPTSELLVRPILGSQGWDHDCGYDGVSIERNIAVNSQVPAGFTVEITKDKKDFKIHLDSSICARHGENISTMAGCNIQTMGRQLAYILRSEMKLKNMKINRTAGGISVTLLGRNIATGLKIEDEVAIGKQLAISGSAGAVTSRGDTAMGANLEIRLRSKDFPVEQDQTTLGLSVMWWGGDVGVMANLQSQFCVGRSWKMGVSMGMNSKQSGQITVKSSSNSELQIAVLGIVPVVISLIRSIYYPARN